MIVRKCTACGKTIKTAPEVKSELCFHCLDLLSREDSYAGICWNCGRITLIGEIPRRLKEVLTEKYLFTKQCSHCTGAQKDDIAWLTFHKLAPRFRLTVTQEGKLFRETDPVIVNEINKVVVL